MASKRILNSPHSTEIYADSIQMHPTFAHMIEQLATLRKQSKNIWQIFQQFKDHVMNDLNKAMGKFSSLVQRQMTTNHQLREELSIVKYSNATMKKQVVQLREMIEEFVKSYNFQIQSKDAEIKELKIQLGTYVQNSTTQQNHSRQTLLPQEEIQNIRKSLQVIQQVSQYTASCVQSIRQMSIPNSAKNTEISENNSYVINQQQQQIEQQKSKKKNNFLNFFRKNVDESIIIESQQKQKQSHSNSIQDLRLGDSDKINMPKAIKSPKHMQLLKKSSKRLMTEQDKQNSNGLQSRTTPHRRNNSYSQSQQKEKSQAKSEKHSRSSSKAGSKQKIKLASKIIEEGYNFQKPSRKVAVTVKPSVHLGGNMYLKKLAKQIRISLQQYKVWEGTRPKQVKYEGEKKNGMRWGKGKLLYDNGFQYDGSFVQNYKHGIGTISLNGIVFYEGQWSLDEISGQGYIKSLKNYSEHCPKYLHEASYCGQLLQNKPHGMGTLFINQNKKFVSKFVHGVPVGDFTFYNLSEIEFGTWF